MARGAALSKEINFTKFFVLFLVWTKMKKHFHYSLTADLLVSCNNSKTRGLLFIRANSISGQVGSVATALKAECS